MRNLSAADRLILGLDRGLRTVLGAGDPGARPNPADDVTDGALDDVERRHAAGLMRVDHAGEVAAQALYHGQALTARSERVRTAFEAAAREENDHLVWCQRRVEELGGQVSLLGPVWYAGSFAIGALAGALGDRISLGFVAETERQVTRHLEDHLARLPEADGRSRAILAQMKVDESEHATRAAQAGAARMPPAVRGLMQLVSRVMTTTASRL